MFCLVTIVVIGGVAKDQKMMSKEELQVNCNKSFEDYCRSTAHAPVSSSTATTTKKHKSEEPK
jgi:hypothetical protein